MGPDAKKRLSAVFGFMNTIFHWGFIPAILYLGFNQGADPGLPEFSLLSILWQ